MGKKGVSSFPVIDPTGQRQRKSLDEVCSRANEGALAIVAQGDGHSICAVVFPRIERAALSQLGIAVSETKEKKVLLHLKTMWDPSLEGYLTDAVKEEVDTREQGSDGFVEEVVTADQLLNSARAGPLATQPLKRDKRLESKEPAKGATTSKAMPEEKATTSRSQSNLAKGATKADEIPEGASKEVPEKEEKEPPQEPPQGTAEQNFLEQPVIPAVKLSDQVEKSYQPVELPQADIEHLMDQALSTQSGTAAVWEILLDRHQAEMEDAPPPTGTHGISSRVLGARTEWDTHDYVRSMHKSMVLQGSSVKKLNEKVDGMSKDLKRVEGKIDATHKTFSKFSEYVAKVNMTPFIQEKFPEYELIHPVRSAKVNYCRVDHIEDLALKCLRGEKDENGKHTERDVPMKAEIDLNFHLLGDNGSICFVVEVSRSTALVPGVFRYPVVPEYTRSTKLIFKLVQLERDIVALQQSSPLMNAVGAAVASASFDDMSDMERDDLLNIIMASEVRNHLPNLAQLHGVRRLFLRSLFY